MDRLLAEIDLTENEELKSLEENPTEEATESKDELNIEEIDIVSNEDVITLHELDRIQNETGEDLSEKATDQNELEVAKDCQSMKQIKIEQYVEMNPQDKTLDWWIDRIIPPKKKRTILIDVDIIDKASSELRIIIFEILLVFCLSVGVLVQMGSYWISTSKQPIVVMPQIETDKEFMPISRLALIDENSTVWDVSLAPKSPSQGKLLKLPKSKQYVGYSDPHGVLYFIDGELRKPVTKYHKTFNHKTIKIGTYEDMSDQVYSKSQQIGQEFWLLARYSDIGHESPYHPQTHVWSKRKERLVNGPKLPTFIDVEESFCTCAINATHLAIAVIEETIFSDYVLVRLRLLNFFENIWVTIGVIQYKHPVHPKECKIALIFDKFHKSKLLVQIQLADLYWLQLTSIETWTCEPKQDTFGLWTKLSMPFPQLSRIIYLGIIQGIIHSVTENGEIFQWDNSGSWTLIESQNVKTTFVIPYIEHY